MEKIRKIGKYIRCVYPVLLNEGGYQCDPNDNGNWSKGKLIGTKYGISARSFPDEDIKNLTVFRAMELYHSFFWEKMKLDLVNVHAAVHILDFGINAGRGTAIRKAQRLVGVEDDGKMGPITANAINLDDNFVKNYKHARIVYYTYLADKYPRYKKYLKEWTKRVKKTKLIF